MPMRSDIEYHSQQKQWGVFAGCEGDDPRPVAFFIEKEHAEEYLKSQRNHEHDGGWQIAPALLVSSCGLNDDGPGFVTIDHFEIETHQQLMEALTEEGFFEL